MRKFDFTSLERSQLRKIEQSLRNTTKLFTGSAKAVLVLSILAIMADNLLNKPLGIPPVIAPIAIMVFFCILLAFLIHGLITGNNRPAKEHPLKKFAREHGLEFTEKKYIPSELRSYLDKRLVRAGFSTIYKFDILNGEDYEFGFIKAINTSRDAAERCAFFFEEKLPFETSSLILDSKIAKYSRIETFANKGLVSLEGDFNNFFNIQTIDTLEAKSNATALLSPEIMAKLIDEFQDYDIEFFNDTIIISVHFESEVRSNLISERIDILEENLQKMSDLAEMLAERANLIRN